MFLMVENKGLSDISALTVLGLSTSRDKVDKIGRFGTGFLHGVLNLLRNNINPYIYLGQDELVFYTAPAKLAEQKYHELWYIYKGEKHKMSCCLEFGEIDWNDISMSLREFISNAIDNSEEYNVDVTVDKSPKEGYTRIFLPFNQDIQKYFNELKWRFLHFQNKHKQKFLETSGNPKIYRKGVFVREIKAYCPALYDYNFDELPIDECRNLDDYKARTYIAKAITTDPDILKQIFVRFNLNKDFFEAGLSSYTLSTQHLKSVWKSVYPKGVACISTSFFDRIRRKGYIPVLLSTDWYEACVRAGITTDVQLLGAITSKGGVETETSETTVRIAKKYWKLFQKHGMTNGKRFPNIKNFEQQMNAGEQTFGYYDEGTVYINTEHALNHITILEELVHHVTGSTDMSRDFQEFLLKLVVKAS